MDVDLLRPGTVPIAPDTVLWFEFLIDHDLLLKHLEKNNPDPPATDLITRFHEAVLDTLRNQSENGETVIIEPNVDKIKQPSKNIALKILSLKIAAYLKWNLNQIRLLPFKIQINLLQDLLYFTNNEENVEIPNVEDVSERNINDIPSPYLFALLLYHRWIISVAMHKITSSWSKFGCSDVGLAEENFICSPENVRKSIDFLTNALNWTKRCSIIAFDCLELPTDSGELMFNWDNCLEITKEELNAQISYDLGTFFFYKENYTSAIEHFSTSVNNYRSMIKENAVGFANFSYNTLDVYIRTCRGTGQDEKASLMEQLNNSIVNHYKGITGVLQKDNIYREIPLTHRLSLELDIQGALSSGAFTVAKDLLNKIRALNVVRCMLDRKPLYHCSNDLWSKQAEILIWAFQQTWKLHTDEDKSVLKRYLLEVVLKSESSELLELIQTNEVLCSVFDRYDLQYIKKQEMIVKVPDSLIKTDWIIYDFTRKRKPIIELLQLEHQIISTYNIKEIRELVTKFGMSQLCPSIWNVNPKWELPIPLQSVLKSLPKGFLQDFGLVMLAKAKEMMLIKNWTRSLELLLILDKEIDSSNLAAEKLSKLIGFEVLLVKITQLLDEWPKSSIDKTAIANACEACLQTTDTVLPRTEITEACLMCLLNLGRWEFLINYDKRWPSFEIAAAIALGCQELIKHKGKLSKNLWDIVLPTFVTTPQTKRSSVGQSVIVDNQIASLRTSIMNVFSKLVDSTVLAVVISMLTRLNNILKDESTLELQVEYATLWPTVISNANSYNSKIANEALYQIVNQALRYYPNNVSWLRLMGDINFANGNYNLSLSFYLKSLLICYDYFNIPVRHDDHVFRRMMKCCTALGCVTQAAVLCQFLEDPDYILAFRILGDQKSSNDAVDAYYHCFWDTNILEFLIHIHHKKGEYQRRKCAIHSIGLLEINSSNNEEIQREAVNLRKGTFLRALCKQYLL